MSRPKGIAEHHKVNHVELKPCPFCGSIPQPVDIGVGRGGIAIRCINPKCRVKPSTDANEGHIGKVSGWWNKRAACNCFVLPFAIAGIIYFGAWAVKWSRVDAKAEREVQEYRQQVDDAACKEEGI